MLIQGPFKISVIDHQDSAGRELHLDFTPEFQSLSPSERASVFRDYVTDLKKATTGNTEITADLEGMLIVLQVAEQLLPHIESNEIHLAETVVIDIKPDTSLGNLIAGVSHQ